MNEPLAIAIQSGIPTILWGPPGTGKTATVIAAADNLGLPLEIVSPAGREPTDFTGLPVIREAGVAFEPPAWARRLAESGRGILFLDEVSTATPAVQAALLRVILDRVVGDLILPTAISMVAAANPPDQAAGGWDLAPPLANRFLHLTWALDVNAWVSGMLTGWPRQVIPRVPEGWEACIPAARQLVASFVRHRPQLFLRVPESEDAAGHAWPSPRTWDMAARVLAAADAAGVGNEAKAVLVAGCVGDGAAMEFISWVRELDLPDPEEVLADPSRFTLPARGDQAFAALAAIAAAAVRDLTKNRWLAAWEVLAIAASQGGRDIAATAARTLASARRPDLPLPQKQLREFIPVLKAGGLI